MRSKETSYSTKEHFSINSELARTSKNAPNLSTVVLVENLYQSDGDARVWGRTYAAFSRYRWAVSWKKKAWTSESPDSWQPPWRVHIDKRLRKKMSDFFNRTKNFSMQYCKLQSSLRGVRYGVYRAEYTRTCRDRRPCVLLVELETRISLKAAHEAPSFCSGSGREFRS